MDCVGGEKSWDLCRRNRVLKENGRYVTLVGDEVGAKVDFAFIASVFGKVISRKLSAALGHPSWEYLMMDPAQNIEDVAKEKEEPADSAPDDEAKVEEEAVAAAESA